MHITAWTPHYSLQFDCHLLVFYKRKLCRKFSKSTPGLFPLCSLLFLKVSFEPQNFLETPRNHSCVCCFPKPFQNIILKITCQLSWAWSGVQIHSCFSIEESEFSLFCEIKRSEDSNSTAQGGVWKVSDANLSYSQETQLFPPLQSSCPCCWHIRTFSHHFPPPHSLPRITPDSLAHPEPPRSSECSLLMFFGLGALELCLPSKELINGQMNFNIPTHKENRCSEESRPRSFQDRPKIGLFNSAASTFREEKRQ